ncbi:hypothetical protein BaRGS_00001979 [Batillaria attramentaria]|uniref:Uncharacterized protein n=1 Tax=Batillaria attramentaria TaxID=370345 RepID=A0ABD0M3U5_9CAEN
MWKTIVRLYRISLAPEQPVSALLSASRDRCNTGHLATAATSARPRQEREKNNLPGKNSTRMEEATVYPAIDAKHLPNSEALRVFSSYPIRAGNPLNKPVGRKRDGWKTRQMGRVPSL